MSGRPLWQNRELNLANAYVAAWLPGTEGGGISDVLFRKKDGAVNFDFTGKLSYSWPRDATGAPLNVGQDNYDPLFPLGFGTDLRRAGRNSRRCPRIRAFRPSSCPPVRTSTRACPCSPGRCASRAAPTPRASPPTPAEAVGGRVKVTAVDDQVQEGARRFVFAGDGKAAVQITSEGAVDLSRETNGDVMLLVRLRRDGDVPKDVGDRRGLRRRLPRPGALRRYAAGAFRPASGRSSACRSSASPRAARTPARSTRR